MNFQDRYRALEIHGRGMYMTSGILVQMHPIAASQPCSSRTSGLQGLLDFLRVGSLFHVAHSGDMLAARQETSSKQNSSVSEWEMFTLSMLNSLLVYMYSAPIFFKSV